MHVLQFHHAIRRKNVIGCTRYELQKAVLVKTAVRCYLVSDAVCFCRLLVMFCNNLEPPSVSRRWNQRFSSKIFLLVLLGRGSVFSVMTETNA